MTYTFVVWTNGRQRYVQQGFIGHLVDFLGSQPMLLYYKSCNMMSLIGQYRHRYIESIHVVRSGQSNSVNDKKINQSSTILKPIMSVRPQFPSEVIMLETWASNFQVHAPGKVSGSAQESNERRYRWQVKPEIAHRKCAGRSRLYNRCHRVKLIAAAGKAGPSQLISTIAFDNSCLVTYGTADLHITSSNK